MTAHTPGNCSPQSDSLPTLVYNEEAAHKAFTRYSALRKAERDDPTLSAEPRFQDLLSRAWTEFSAAFWRLV